MSISEGEDGRDGEEFCEVRYSVSNWSSCDFESDETEPDETEPDECTGELDEVESDKCTSELDEVDSDERTGELDEVDSNECIGEQDKVEPDECTGELTSRELEIAFGSPKASPNHDPDAEPTLNLRLNPMSYLVARDLYQSSSWCEKISSVKRWEQCDRRFVNRLL